MFFAFIIYHMFFISPESVMMFFQGFSWVDHGTDPSPISWNVTSFGYKFGIFRSTDNFWLPVDHPLTTFRETNWLN